ncbi:MAG: hypothetical protein WCL50_11825 [Spirochaetota bacterium]
MSQFVAFAEGVEVNGETVLAFLDCTAGFREECLAILAAHGISSPQKGEWYPEQAWLDSFAAISTRVGKTTLNRIGMMIQKSSIFPADIKRIEDALAAIDKVYHQSHRGGEIGEYSISPLGARKSRVTCRNPHPCEFDHGLVEAVAVASTPADSKQVTVVHARGGLPCRQKGGDFCAYDVSW